MSRYSWRVKNAWIGVMQRYLDEDGLFARDRLLGVIRRSGVVRQLGNFCSVVVSVCGKEYIASGAEARIFPFHSIRLEEGDRIPSLELEAVGWCKDHNTYAFRNGKGDIVELIDSGNTLNNTKPIPKDNWPVELEADNDVEVPT